MGGDGLHDLCDGHDAQRAVTPFFLPILRRQPVHEIEKLLPVLIHARQQLRRRFILEPVDAPGVVAIKVEILRHPFFALFYLAHQA